MGIAIAVSAVAVMLGFWQYGRHVVRADAIVDFDQASRLSATAVSDLIPTGATTLPEGAQWRTVTATGTFDHGSSIVLRNRPVDSTAAWQYLAWLDTDDGRSFLVNLAWVRQPGPADDPPVPDFDPDETVTVTVVLREWEPDDGKDAGASITRITPSQLPEPSHEPVPGYGMLREICGDEGCTETPVGAPVPLPDLTTGPHLSYAWQWWLFAAMAPTGGVLLLRRDAQVAAEETATGAAAAEPASSRGDAAAKPARASAGRRRRRREPSDEEIEDAL